MKPMLLATLLSMSAAGGGATPWTSTRQPIALACTATDGDTLRCGAERVRLVGIDAPETADHCRPGRRCAPGDPVAASRALAAALAGKASITRIGVDRYGRTLALVSVGGVDLSCAQLRRGHAVYRRDWDKGGRVRAICPEVAL